MPWRTWGEYNSNSTKRNGNYRPRYKSYVPRDFSYNSGRKFSPSFVYRQTQRPYVIQQGPYAKPKYKRKSKSKTKTRTKADPSFNVITSLVPNGYHPTADIIPENSIRVSLVHVSDPGVVRTAEGHRAGSVYWKGSVDKVAYEFDGVGVLAHRRIFFTSLADYRGSADRYIPLSSEYDDSPDIEVTYSRRVPAGRPEKASICKCLTELFPSALVADFVSGKIKTDVDVVSDRSLTYYGKDGGSQKQVKTRVYYGAAKKGFGVTYVRDSAGRATDSPLAEAKKLYRLDIFVYGMEVRDLQIPTSGSPSGLKRAASSGGIGIGAGTKKVKTESDISEGVEGMDIEGHDAGNAAAEMMRTTESTESSVRVRMDTRVYYVASKS